MLTANGVLPSHPNAAAPSIGRDPLEHEQRMVMASAMQTENVAPQALATERSTELRALVQKEIGDWASFAKRVTEGRPSPLRKLISPHCLLWGLPTSATIHQALPTRLLALRKRAGKSEQDFDWEAEARSWQDGLAPQVDRDAALAAVAWSHAMPLLVSRLTEASWMNLLATLARLHYQSAAGHRRGVPEFLLASEVPLALAYALPQCKACVALKDSSRAALGRLIDALFDGEGMPHAEEIADIQLLLASCTRMLTLDAHVKKGRIHKDARLQVDWLVRQTLRYTRPDGSAIFTPDRDSPFFDELFGRANQLTEDQADKAAFTRLRAKRKAAEEADCPTTSEHSEWSELATMRTSWQPSAARLAVDFSKAEIQVEIGAGRHTLLSGSFAPHIEIDGHTACPESEWEEVCWESDDDMDYLEIECTLSQDWRLQRQFLLAREDRFAFVADALLGPTSARIVYRHSYPLAGEITMEQADEANEAMLLNSTRRGTLIPLALPEWQSESRVERLRSDPARLDIQRTGRALYVPLVIDLHASRLKKALTWRKLTVAENLQILPADSAAAFRLQIGKQQWVFYRSLDRPANRTVLGLNLMSEFLAARFQKDGEIETLVDIAG